MAVLHEFLSPKSNWAFCIFQQVESPLMAKFQSQLASSVSSIIVCVETSRAEFGVLEKSFQLEGTVADTFLIDGTQEFVLFHEQRGEQSCDL